MKLYMFRIVLLSIIRSLSAVHSAMVYVTQVCRRLSSRTRMELRFHPAWHLPLLSIQWIKSWWWTDEQSETCTVSWQNKFVNLVHVVGFITKKFVTMHGHMNVKKNKSHFLFCRRTFPCTQHASSHTTYNQHVLIAPAIIIRISLQEY